MIKRIQGTRDILPEEISAWQRIEKISRSVFSLYNYCEIRPPLIEESALFNRTLGESAEIVQKQMFLVEKGRDSYALRPEGTASIARAYIENNLDKKFGLTKLYYLGPMFRRERPQKGRLRQFHHIGCEAIGSIEPELDIEIIALADALLKAYSIKDYQFKVNSLGCDKDKQKLSASLKQELKNKLPKLCPDCNTRFKKNVLRILDCKNEECIKIVRGLDLHTSHLCPECKSHFGAVKEGLDSLGLNYIIDPYLVRGLDYYTRTVFEIVHSGLGAQDALGAGGRYDNLIKELGGTPAGATGFAFGVERLLLASGACLAASERNLVYLITIGDEAKKQGPRLLAELRRAGVCADTDYEGRSLKGEMRRANDLKAKYVLIFGEDEIKEGIITLKDMSSSEQRRIKLNDLIEDLKNLLKKG